MSRPTSTSTPHPGTPSPKCGAPTNNPCPMCGGFDSTYWCYSTIGRDVWSCRCGHDFEIIVSEPSQQRT